MRFLSLAAGLFLIVSLTAASPPDTSGDLGALQGSWKLVAGEIGGQKMAAEQLKKAKLLFNGDRYTVRRGNGPTVTGIVKLDATKSPKTIDITDADGSYKGKTLLGIYSVKGGELTECFAPPGKARPAKFATQAGTSQFLHVWKHVKN